MLLVFHWLLAKVSIGFSPKCPTTKGLKSVVGQVRVLHTPILGGVSHTHRAESTL